MVLIAFGLSIGMFAWWPARSASAFPVPVRPIRSSPLERGVPAAVYRPPTSAPVRDPFRPPPEPWLPGNRGIEYATTPGTPITAIGPGVVAFVGPVAGRVVVTVNHPDGLRSSYVGLAGAAVTEGDRVDGGQVVGLSLDSFHLGVRRGDTYVDPAMLWGTAVGAGRVVLVPTG